MVTRDKDLSQLVGRGDRFWDYSDAAEYGYEQIAERFGVAPERMADYLALTGDAVDNIPGVPGIGPKTAAALLSRYASLEELYEDLEQRRLPAAARRRASAGQAARASRGRLPGARADAHPLRRAARRRPRIAPPARPGATGDGRISAAGTALAPCCSRQAERIAQLAA